MDRRMILIADDEPHLLQAMMARLREAGYTVLGARDGREALELAQAAHPDLVVVDYQMPRLSGLELCQRLRQEQSTRGIPAIMLGVRGYNLTPGNLHSTGIRQVLTKPVAPRQLLAAVDQALAA
jgi:DNA-binding response OmpR family regulator